MWEVIDSLGEEVFEEFFDDLSTMYIYTLNTIAIHMEDDDSSFYYTHFEKSTPFLMDVMAHMILQFPDPEGGGSYAPWIDEDEPAIDYFNFDSDSDFMEALQTVELLCHMSEGGAHEQFYSHRHSDLIIQTII